MLEQQVLGHGVLLCVKRPWRPLAPLGRSGPRVLDIVAEDFFERSAGLPPASALRRHAVEERSDEAVLGQLVLRLAEPVALTLEQVQLDIAAARPQRVDEGNGALDRHDGIGRAVEHEQRHGHVAHDGERRSVAVPLGILQGTDEADRRVGLEPVAARRQLGEIGHGEQGDPTGHGRARPPPSKRSTV